VKSGENANLRRQGSGRFAARLVGGLVALLRSLRRRPFWVVDGDVVWLRVLCLLRGKARCCCDEPVMFVFRLNVVGPSRTFGHGSGSRE
jgi:hypothetical protein